MRNILFAVLLLLSFSLAACQSGQDSTPTPTAYRPKLASQSPDIRGEITQISQNEGVTARIQVEGKIEADTTYDKASVAITDTTRIYEKVADDYVLRSSQDLYLGMRVEVLFTGVVLESYPVQVQAEEIIILP